MNDTNKAIVDAIKAQECYEKLSTTQSMCEIADIIDELDTEMLKHVLKKFVHARK